MPIPRIWILLPMGWLVVWGATLKATIFVIIYVKNDICESLIECINVETQRCGPISSICTTIFNLITHGWIKILWKCERCRELIKNHVPEWINWIKSNMDNKTARFPPTRFKTSSRWIYYSHYYCVIELVNKILTFHSYRDFKIQRMNCERQWWQNFLLRLLKLRFYSSSSW